MQLNNYSKVNALIVALVFSGCATFEPGLRYQDLTKPRHPTVKAVQEGLEVSVEEFASTDKSQKAFDADLASYGILPLLIGIENAGSLNYLVQRNHIKASIDGQPISQLLGEQAANEAGTREYAGKALGWTVATGPFFILLWPATIAGSAAHTASVNRRIEQHFESLAFTDALLKPNQTATGFVYFKLPDGTKKLNGLTVEIELSEEKTGTKHTFNLSLPSFELSAPTPSPENG